MKAESLVNAQVQHVAVNTFPGLVHPPGQHPNWVLTRSRWLNRKESRLPAEGDWGWTSRNKVAVSEGAAGSPPF